jgi:hypothetical protein
VAEGNEEGSNADPAAIHPQGLSAGAQGPPQLYDPQREENWLRDEQVILTAQMWVSGLDSPCPDAQRILRILRVGQNHVYYGVHTVFLAGKSPNVRSHTVYIYRSGQPYAY